MFIAQIIKCINAYGEFKDIYIKVREKKGVKREKVRVFSLYIYNYIYSK